MYVNDGARGVNDDDRRQPWYSRGLTHLTQRYYLGEL